MVSQTKSPKYFIYFVAAFLTCSLTQEVLLNRFISLDIGSAYITGGAFICLTSLLIIDIVTEVYGYKLARQMVWCGFFAPLIMAVFITICLRMPYPTFWSKVIMAYQISLGSILRVAIVSAVALLVGQFINAYLISKWKILTKGKYFWLRSLGSSCIGDTVSVITAIILIFAGRAPFHMMIVNIVTNLATGFFFTAVGAIPAAGLAKVMSKIERLDNYDTGVNFNPFKLNS